MLCRKQHPTFLFVSSFACESPTRCAARNAHVVTHGTRAEEAPRLPPRVLSGGAARDASAAALPRRFPQNSAPPPSPTPPSRRLSNPGTHVKPSATASVRRGATPNATPFFFSARAFFFRPFPRPKKKPTAPQYVGRRRVPRARLLEPPGGPQNDPLLVRRGERAAGMAGGERGMKKTDQPSFPPPTGRPPSSGASPWPTSPTFPAPSKPSPRRNRWPSRRRA